MTEHELKYILSLKDEATAVWKKFTGSVTKGSGDMRSMIGGIGVAIGSAFSIAAAGEFMKAAADSQAEVARLDQVLKSQGITTEGVSEEMQRYSQEMMNKIAVDDDEITHIQATILAMTGNLEATRKLTPAVFDLAKATGMNADQAAKLFSKSVEGAEGLKKLGITIGPTATEAERFERIYEEINRKFGGQAAAWAQTDAGKIELLHIALGNLEESVGGVLNNALMPLLPAITETVKEFSALPAPLQTATVAVGGLTVAVLLLNTALFANPLTYVALAAAGLTAAIIGTNQRIRESNIEFDDFNVKLGASVATMFGYTSWLNKSTEEVQRHKDALMMVSPHAEAAKKALADAANVKSGSTSDTLKKLRDELEKLTVGTSAYQSKLIEIARIEKQVSDATEAAKRSYASLKDEMRYVQADLDQLTPGTDAYTQKLYDLTRMQRSYAESVNQSEIAVSMLMNRFDGLQKIQGFGLQMSAVKDEFQATGVQIEEMTGLFEESDRIMQERARNIQSVVGIMGNAIGDMFYNAFTNQEDVLKEFLKASLGQIITFVEGVILAASAKALADTVLSFGVLAGELAIIAPAFAGLELARAVINRFHDGGSMGQYGQRIPLASDERPAILRVGETVRTVEQERRLQQSASAPAGTVIHVHLDGANIADEKSFIALLQRGMRAIGVKDVNQLIVNNSDGLALA